ncbi:MAG: 7-carboxy-7-deazaguanine synthase QueE [Saprospiraceae bacterium]
MSSSILKLARFNDGPEIFYTIQGEGRHVGRPSIFVRASLCNLHCYWCDTDYTWNWEGTRFAHVNDAMPGYAKFVKSDWIHEIDAGELAQQIAMAYPCLHVVITGGEPLLQQDGFVALMRAMKAMDARYFFEVETNGTLVPDPEFDLLIDQYNVSPKLANSRNALQLRERPDALHFFAENSKAYFKFVIAEQDDLREMLAICNRYKIPFDRTWLMPEGRSKEVLQQRRHWLVEACKQYGFNYSDRLHIQVWGDRRGV